MGRNNSSCDYDAQVDGYKDTIAQNETEIADLKKQLNSAKNKLSKYQNKGTSDDSSNDDKQQILTLQRTVDDLNSKNDELQSKIDDLNSQISSLDNTDNTQTKQTLQDMTDKYKKLKDQYQELADNPCPELKKANDSYKQQIDQLQLQLQNCQKGSGWNDEAAKNMQKQLDQANSRIKELEDSVSQLTDKNNESTKSVQDITDQNNQLQTDLAKYKDTVDNLNSKLQPMVSDYGNTIKTVNNVYKQIQNIINKIFIEVDKYNAAQAKGTADEKTQTDMKNNINTVLNDEILEKAVKSAEWSMFISDLKPLKDITTKLYENFDWDTLKSFLDEMTKCKESVDQKMIQMSNNLIQFDITKTINDKTETFRSSFCLCNIRRLLITVVVLGFIGYMAYVFFFKNNHDYNENTDNVNFVDRFEGGSEYWY